MAAFATDIPPHIYEFHLYLGNSAILSGTKLSSFGRTTSVKLRAFTPDLQSRLHALYAQ